VLRAARFTPAAVITAARSSRALAGRFCARVDSARRTSTSSAGGRCGASSPSRFVPRQPAGEHREQRHRQLVDVGDHRRRLAEEALRRHVGGRAADAAVLGRRRRRRGELLGDPEVEQHRVLATVDAGDQHHVLGLEIAVDQAAGVEGVDRVGELAEQLERLLDRQRAARDPRRQRLAVKLLHREVGPPVGDLADREHLDDAGVVDLGEPPRLDQELLPLLRRRRERGVQHLQRDLTVTPASVVDDAAAAFAEHS
jgi:hypothetical protein